MSRTEDKRRERAASMRQRIRENSETKGQGDLRLKDKVDSFKPKEGRNRISIVPFKMTKTPNLENVPSGDEYFRLRVRKHYNVGPEGKVVVCPKTFGKKCPICEEQRRLVDSGKKWDDEVVSELRARVRDYYNVIDLDVKGPITADRLLIWEVAEKNFGRVLDTEIKDDYNTDDSLQVTFADSEAGANLTVRMKTDSFGKTKYLAADKIDYEERKPLPQEVLDAAVPFDQVIIVLGYDEIARIFFDMPDSSDSEDDDTGKKAERPERSRRRDDEDDKDQRPSREERRQREDERQKSRDDEPARDRRASRSKEGEDKPSRSAEKDPPRRDKEEKAPPEHKCIAKGGVFGGGKSYPECGDDCLVWDECQTEYENREARKARAARKTDEPDEDDLTF